MKKKKTKIKYTPDLAGRMYLFFISYDEIGAPSFVKFAKSIGATSADLERFRSHKHFNRAYLECLEIRRDFMIDRALERRFDGSFVKFLLSSAEEDEGGEFTLRLEVKE